MPSALVTFLLINLSHTLQGQSVVINFNAIPDGTLVSANNPYGGALNIQALEITDYQVYTANDVIYYSTSTEASIVGGSLTVLPLYTTDFNYYQSRSEMTATFEQPVIGVSFDAWCWRNAVYTYSGVDGNQLPLSSWGIIPGVVESGTAPELATYSLNLPAGGYLTSFSISNRDYHTANAAFWVNNIVFTTVPEPSTAVLLLLILVIVWDPRTGPKRISRLRAKFKNKRLASG